ncbi:MFS transporter [Micromonospora sp. NPDC049523]|uniref:MFS transporter n=1 Tax=Micromonospora sp. NPDC049523 TaxID=3155921 RepID=UPI003426D769
MVREVRTVLDLKPYRKTLALPGLRPLLLVSILARVPMAASAVVLTLHVVGMGYGYAAAGAVGGVMTVGSALGAPLLGRLVDRRGLRPVLLLTTLASAVFWLTAPHLSYPVLLGSVLFGGLLTLPVFSVVRQSIAALVPPERRRQAYALDSMSVEVSFMTGPALAVLLATTVSPEVTMFAIGAGMALSGVILFVLNPPTRTAAEATDPGRPVARREWLTPRLIGLLAISVAGTLVLGGTDVSVVAVLREHDQVGWTGAVLSMWAAYSLVGGFAYGALSRPVSPLLLTVLLGLATIPVGLGGGRWWLLSLALLPAGALCAPTLAATADAVSRLVPASVRGEAMGLHGSAITVGVALGAPLAGAVIDASSPAWGFAATGLLGALIALLSLPLTPHHPHPNPADPSLIMKLTHSEREKSALTS